MARPFFMSSLWHHVSIPAEVDGFLIPSPTWLPHCVHVFIFSLCTLSLFILSLSLSLFSFFSPLSDGLSREGEHGLSLSLPLLSLFSFFSRLRFSGSSVRHFISFLTRDLDLNKPFFDLCCCDSLDPKRTNLVSVSLEQSGLLLQVLVIFIWLIKLCS